tara:strand:- start:325 stop:882 length:558 start_codon:yes stop_codon:yes gene_type:complete
MIDSSSPNQPIQNYEIVNSGLEAQVASLLPSVAGYGGNLRSTNTIIPVVDLTAAAEGSTVPFPLQTALAFQSQTAFQAASANTDVATTPGFWRLTGTANVFSTTSAVQRVDINLIDATPTTKVVWSVFTPAGLGVNSFLNCPFDFFVFLDTGEKINVSASAKSTVVGSVRQVATSTGELVTPGGF